MYPLTDRCNPIVFFWNPIGFLALEKFCRSVGQHNELNELLHFTIFCPAAFVKCKSLLSWLISSSQKCSSRQPHKFYFEIKIGWFWMKFNFNLSLSFFEVGCRRLNITKDKNKSISQKAWKKVDLAHYPPLIVIQRNLQTRAMRRAAKLRTKSDLASSLVRSWEDFDGP